MSEAISFDKSLLIRKAYDFGKRLKAVKAALGDLYPAGFAALGASIEAHPDEIQTIQTQLEEAQETLRAIRSGEVVALEVQ